MEKLKLILLGMPALLSSCGTPKVVTATEKTDTAVEVRYETVYVKDTVFIDVPAQVSERATRDSTSRLENDYAESTARIDADGMLYHDLRTKPQRVAAEVSVPVTTRDSIVVMTREVETPVLVEKELTGWQSFRLKWFYVLAAAVVALLAWTFRSPLRSLFKMIT